MIDEAPWLSLLDEEPTKVPLDWLSPGWWEACDARASESQKSSAIDVLAKIFLALSSVALGEVRPDLTSQPWN